MKTKLYTLLLLLGACWGPLLLNAGGSARAATVTGFVLVNADTDLDIFALTPGMTVDLNTLPTRNLNIRADVDTSPVGSVTFELSGAQAQVATENVPPYALFSDVAGDYFAWTPLLGSYTLTATPYDGGSGTGAAGTPLTLSFSVVDSGVAVTSFTLVNADTDLDLIPLTNGMVLHLGELPANGLNIRANVQLPAAGSVEFSLSGAQTQVATENVPPYALFSDVAGDYFAWFPTPGSYTLTATPYATANGTGAAGTPLTLTFSVSASPLPVQLTSFVAMAVAASEVQLRWATASEHNCREFEVQRSLDGRQFATVGRAAGHGTTTVAQAYAYSDHELPGQAATLYYRLRQVDTDGTSAFSPVQVVALRRAAAELRLYSPLLPAEAVRYSFSGPLVGDEQLQLYNLLGQGLGQFPVAAGGAGTVPTAGLAAGVYVLRMGSAQGTYSGRFVVP
ncbi:T9SS type A sorting domain-containing protein [Hymenobacter sp. 5317J-9]|uniref:T9SS type A sorting domain-containing protein n=1 Tax=Hymenobacter sp. 5317J-9 TaxID=2932250 RepID=UPI001FD6772D|nr:T9SS type A sorting domain-containing protein [Hymenobacter sp. 5317J-9]UOQ96692.1 T9SS type A sorting domain-containing protein [Hymenobacter sp. 5317J-9]